jgi:hypothetical protein
MSFAAVAIGGAVVAGAGTIGKAIGRSNANKQMRKLLAEQPKYQENQLAGQQYALAQNMFNAQMPGTQQYMSGIERTRASQIAAAERGGDNTLLAAAAAGGQANEAGQALAGQQAAYKQSAYGNVAAANQGLIGEQDKVYNDQLRQYQNRTQIEAAINENKQNTWGDITNFGMAAANVGMGGMGGLGKTPSVGTTGSFGNFNPTGKIGNTQFPSNMFSMGYGQPQHTGMPNNWLSMGFGQQNPYPWFKK